MSPRSTKTEKSSKKTTKHSVNELYTLFSEAQKSAREHRTKLYQQLNDETAKDLTLDQACEVVTDLIEADRDQYDHIMLSLIKAYPGAVPTSTYPLTENRHVFWLFLGIFVQHGAKDSAQILLHSLQSHSVPSNCHWTGINEVTRFAVERFGWASLDSIYDVILGHAGHETVCFYLDARLNDERPSPLQYDSRGTRALEARLLGCDWDNVESTKRLSDILERVPSLNRPEFWEKWFEKHLGRHKASEYIELLKKIGGAAVTALHEYMTKVNDAYTIREYLRAFPEVDKEQFIKKLSESWTLDPEKMARDFISGKDRGGYHPMMMYMMCGHGRW